MIRATARRIGDAAGSLWAWLIALALLGIMIGEPAQRWALIQYHKAYPVMTDWEPSAVFVDGNDVVVSGSMFKRYDCGYIPPPRAFDPAGRPFIVTAASTTPALNFPTGARPFGPWRIVNGAVATRIDLVQEHDCGNEVIVFSNLGHLKRPYILEKK
jgi:hypothetical protein